MQVRLCCSMSLVNVRSLPALQRDRRAGMGIFEVTGGTAKRGGIGWVLRAALEGLRLYWPAVVTMQLCAGVAVVLYYNSTGFQAFADRLAGWKAAGGLAFAAAANIVSGGLLPELLKAFLRPQGRKGPTAGELVHQWVYFGISGILVERFYALQGLWLGSGSEPWRLAAKIIIDQFVYTLFIATPLLIAWFAWREQRYRLGATVRSLTLGLFAERLPPLFIPNVIFWAPALICVYSLPPQLQFVLFIFLNAGWCVLAIFIARNQVGAERVMD